MKKVQSLPSGHKLCAFGRKHVLKAIKIYQKNGEQWLKEKGYLKGHGKRTTFVVYEEGWYQIKPVGRIAYKIATGKHLLARYTTLDFEKRLKDKELGFTIVKTWEIPTSDKDELAERVDKALKSVRKAGKSAPHPKGQMKPKRSSVAVDRFYRDPTVVAWVLENADGVCEVCKEPAPFSRDKGAPYLEVHHVRPLAEDGPDSICNAVACCPNCHRGLHYATNRHKVRKKIISRIGRLRHHYAHVVPQ